ncbi:MAG: hypothetical protein LIO62_04250 [Clostridiales bacterium]|nr:hypothetical protein [Clostridiales bacterium]
MNNNTDKLLNNAKNNKIDVNKMKEAANSGNLDEFLSKNLSENTATKLKNILSDKSATEKLLSTPQAKELMKKLTEGK